MFKKLISYTIIFALLWTDVARCGSAASFPKDDPEGGWFIVVRKKPNETTPLQNNTHLTPSQPLINPTEVPHLVINDAESGQASKGSGVDRKPTETIPLRKRRDPIPPPRDTEELKTRSSSDSPTKSSSPRSEDSHENDEDVPNLKISFEAVAKGRASQNSSPIEKSPLQKRDTKGKKESSSSQSPEKRFNTSSSDSSPLLSPNRSMFPVTQAEVQDPLGQRDGKDFGTFIKGQRPKLELPGEENAASPGDSSGKDDQGEDLRIDLETNDSDLDDSDLLSHHNNKGKNPLEPGQKVDLDIQLRNTDQVIVDMGQKEKPLPKFIPDCCKEELVLPIKKWDSSSSLIEQISSDDQEEGPKTATHVLKKRFEHLLSELSPEARASLKDPAEMWEKVLAMLVGAGIGGATAYATSILYNEAIFNLAIHFDHDFIYALKGAGLFNYIIISGFPDAVSRNALYGKKFLSYLSKRRATMKEAACLGAVSFLPSLITPFALISAGFEKIKFFDIYPIVYDEVSKLMLTYSPILYVNDWAFNINMASEIRTNMKKWAGKSDSHFARFLSGRVFYISPPSEDEIRKRNFNKTLGALVHALPTLSNERMGEIYETLHGAKAMIVTELPDLELENLEAAHSFLTFRYLLALGEEMEQTTHFSQEKPETGAIIDLTKQEKGPEMLCELVEDIQISSSALLLCEDEKDKKIPSTQSWYEFYEKVTNRINYAALSLGTPVRLITLKYIVQDILKSMVYAASEGEGEVSATVKAFSWGIAFAMGLAAQTGFEYKGMKNLTKMLWSKNYEGHESYPWARRFTKLCSTVQGFILTIPIAVLVLQALTEEFGEDWLKNPEYMGYKWASLLIIVPYLLPECAVQTTLVEEAYNQTILTGAADICHSSIVWPKITGLRDTYNSIQPINCLKWESNFRNYQQDWLIRFVKEKQKDMHNLHPEIFFQLEQLLIMKNQKEFQNL